MLARPTRATAPSTCSPISRYVLSVVQVATAVVFLATGGAKLSGYSTMVDTFEKIGIGQWFRYVAGSIEVASAAGLFVPALAPFAGLLLAFTMIGAVATHLLVLGGSPTPALVLLATSSAIAWFRRDRLWRSARRLRRRLDMPSTRSEGGRRATW